MAEPPGLPDGLQSALAALNRERMLDPGQAALVVGVSRSLVDDWCRRDQPLPHDHRPGKRPARLISEREVADFALGEPTVRATASRTLLEGQRGAAGALKLLPPSQVATAELHRPAAQPEGAVPAVTPDVSWTSRPDLISDSAHARSNVGAVALPNDVGDLQARVVSLSEQVAYLTGLVEELEESAARKAKLWLGAVRAGGVPGTPAGLDGLNPSGAGQPQQAGPTESPH